MNAGLNHSYGAFPAMMAAEAEADARAIRDFQKATPGSGVRFSNEALIHSRSATGAALIRRFPGRLSNAALPILP